MRCSSIPLLALASTLAGLTYAQDAAHWASLASKSKDGVIKLDSASYEAILKGGQGQDRDYSVVVELTAMGSQFKCAPCHEFHPSFSLISASWKRQPASVRDTNFFASLDFEQGQAVYQKLGLSTAPTVQFHPAQTSGGKLGVVTYDLNRAGLHAGAFHTFLRPHLPSFDIHIPFNPIPLILTITSLLLGSFTIYALWSSLLPIIQSRFLWGGGSLVLILTFTSGHMWNRIKNAPYVAGTREGGVTWIAQGFQNQLGMESQVVAGMYGTLAFTVLALTLLVPAQTSPLKQRVGVYVWLGVLVVVFGLLMRLFRIKNGAYPFSIIF